MGHAMKRSNEPVFWALFGAGGMLAALIGPALIFVTGLAVPLGVLPRRVMDYAAALRFAHSPFGKLALLAVVALFMFHACHRMVHSLHDLGVRTGPTARMIFYGFAGAVTLVTFGVLAQLGLK
jgi:fumarate reductase subunit D